MNNQTAEMLVRLTNTGISYSDATALRRIAMTLHRWHELECGDGTPGASWCLVRGRKDNGGAFEYDDNGKPFMKIHPNYGTTTPYYRSIPDREAGAKKRLAKIMANYPDHWAYVQTDPRGAALYVGQYNPTTKGSDPSLFYNSGIAVHK